MCSSDLGVDVVSGADAFTAASFVRAVLGVENWANVVGTTVAIEDLVVECHDLHRGRGQWGLRR